MRVNSTSRRTTNGHSHQRNAAPDTGGLCWTPVAIAAAILVGAGTVPPCAAQMCGDGVVESPEECDDGAAGFRLDGCAPDCTFEHVQRLIQLELAEGSSPSVCTPTSNAFGAAFTAIGRAGVNAQLAAALADGTLSQLLQILSLNDPAGVDDADLEVGMASSDIDRRGSTTGLDGWYVARSDSLDGDDLPVVRLTGEVAARELAAGPARIGIVFLDGTITVRDAFVTARIGPSTSLPAPPPDQLAVGFEAFEGLQATDGGHGLCGNITVGSLAVLPLPADFSAGGAAPCSDSCTSSRSYSWCGPGNPVGPDCNSMLDVVVGGCAVSPPLCLPLLVPTQPDVGTGGQPPAALISDPSTGKVIVVQPDDAYSTWLEFAAERVHMTNHLGGIFQDGFEGSGLGAWSSSQP